jgi:hypothetical protein
MVNVKSPVEVIRLDLYSPAGNLIQGREKSARFDLSPVPRGIYFLKITYIDGFTETAKIIRE